MNPLAVGARTNERRALRLVGAIALPVGVVAGVIALIVVGLAAAGGAFVVVTAIVAGWLWSTADTRVHRLLGGAPADAVQHARLVNMVDAVCAGVGVNPPRLVVIDDPGANSLVAGRQARRAVLAVTSGLLEQLSPIELEGVVAEQLVRIRRRDTLPITVALPLGGLGRWLIGPRDDTAADLLAVSVTRYPPGLASALETMAQAGTSVSQVPKVLAPLWLADASAAADDGEHRPPLVERAEALREL